MTRTAFTSNIPRLTIPVPEIEVRRIGHGIELVTVQLPWLTRLHANVRVAAGAYEDPADRDGLAHALEHMVFKGPRGVTPSALARQIESVGGQMNAYTDQDHTTYQVDAPADQIRATLATLGDLVLRPSLRAKDWESERGVILEEILMRADDPGTHLFDRGLQELRAGTPWGRLIIGTEETVRSITIEDLRTFHETHYGAQRLRIAIASPWSADVLMEQIEQAGFAHAAAGAPLVARAAEMLPAGRQVLMDYDSEQLQVALVGRGPSQRDVQLDPTLVIAQLVLDGGMSGRLFQEIREKQGLCYAVGLLHDQNEDSGLLGVYGGTSTTKARPFLDSARAEFARLAEHGITADELNAACVQLRGQILMNALSPQMHLRQALTAHQTGVGPRTVAERIAQIEQIDRDMVNASLARWFAPAAFNELQLGPLESASSQAVAA